MSRGKYFEGIISHELGHGFMQNFWETSKQAPKFKFLLKSAYRNARSNKAIYKRYAETECKFKKMSPCRLVPYALSNEREYFAELSTSVYGTPNAQVGNICLFDRMGCHMIKAAYHPNKAMFDVDNMDPRLAK